MPFGIVRNDITNMAVDAIVNTANPHPVIGSGTDAAIHEKAGPMLLKSRKLIGNIQTCEARITPGFRLPAKYVIYAVGPVWEGGFFHEEELLRQCYDNVLKLAKRHRVKSIAFPLISTGNYGFPKKLALKIAIEAFSAFLMDNEMQIYLVVFSKDAYELSEKLVGDVKSYIGERTAQKKARKEYGFSVSQDYVSLRRAFDREKPSGDIEYARYEPPYGQSRPVDDNFVVGAPSPCDEDMVCESSVASDADECTVRPQMRLAPKASRKALFSADELSNRLKKLDAGFSDRLIQLINESGKKDSEIYKKANIDRKLFSKIKNNPGYKPSKATALAFAIALELNLDDTKDLIGRAGYALSGSSKFDIIIEYFIVHERYDIYEINLMLFEFDQSLLGA